jgi:pimeloyl-ACP methyl ester carboxylesterase
MSEQTAATAPWSPHFTEPDTIDVSGLEVAYRRKGVGPTTVFLHGAGMTRMWLPFYERLSGGLDLVAPEHPGFGDTEMPEWLEGFDDLVLHYRELFDTLELDRVHLVAFSLGGWIAANLAIFYPDRFKSLTLISPAGLRMPDAPMTDFMRMPPEQIGDLLFNGQTMEYLDYFPDPNDIDAAIKGYGEFSTVAKLIWNPRYDYRLDRRVPRIALPALVIEPDQDQIVPNAHAKRWAELLPNARLEKVSGDQPTGHLVMIQEPDRTAETILGFVQEVEG